MDTAKIQAKIKAVGLLSGGLDSTLAAKLVLEQGINVTAVNFTSPFCTCTPKKAGCAAVVTAVKQLGGIPLKRVALKDEYLEIMMEYTKRSVPETPLITHWYRGTRRTVSVHGLSNEILPTISMTPRG
jgi:tRNA(Ile)-lysidine synthase TilS/MesJ